MFVVCTGGHVDHGKSALIEALSGIHPDRLREEQERQMTIDLGFAWVDLAGETVGIVDVPGHKDFIENMLAGMAGIDAFMLVVAVDEGIMPQTLEHLAILDLMGIHRGVVALTKIDLAHDADDIALVEMMIQDALAGTRFPNAPIVPVSARTGEGLPHLIETLTGILADSPPPADHGLPVLPIDRVFTIKGFGTVVTGTLMGGTIAVGDSLQILPQGLSARIRGIQSHHSKLQHAEPGRRVAVNVAGVDKDDLQRGDLLANPQAVQVTSRLDVVLEVAAHSTYQLQHNDEVKLFWGPTTGIGRVRLLGDEYAQIQLRDPLPLQNDSRFILYRMSPAALIGGGRVLDTQPAKRWKSRPETLERFQILAQGSPIEKALYQLQQASLPQPINPILVDHPAVVIIGEWMLEHGVFERVSQQATRILKVYLRQNALSKGMPANQLLHQMGYGNPLWLQVLQLAGTIEERAGLWVLPSHQRQLSKLQQQAVDTLLQKFQNTPYAPPSYKDALKIVDESVLRYLIEDQQLIAINAEVLLSPPIYREILALVRQRLEAGDCVSVAAVRDAFSTSRRVVMALLDELENRGITRRESDCHALHTPAWERVGSV